MGINKKRIAQRQNEAKNAAKQEQNKKITTIAAIVGGSVVVVLLVVLAFAMLLPSCGKADIPKLDKDVYYADIEIENYGKIVVKLDHKAAPITVENFVKLAKEGFYNGLTFHRIIEGFMMQGGCPKGTGTGDAGYEIKGEFAANGWDNPLKHERGTISMARANDPDSASCQFFIVHKTSFNNTASLDGNYAAFGVVTEGMDIVDKICTEVKPSGDNGAVAKEDQPVIKSITIREG